MGRKKKINKFKKKFKKKIKLVANKSVSQVTNKSSTFKSNEEKIKIKKYSMEFRLKIIEIIWKIVYSDGTSDNYESNLIRRICGLLYISDKDNGIIKTKVKNLKEI